MDDRLTEKEAEKESVSSSDPDSEVEGDPETHRSIRDVVQWLGGAGILFVVLVICGLSYHYRYNSVRVETMLPEDTELFVSVRRFPLLLRRYRSLNDNQKNFVQNLSEFWGVRQLEKKMKEKGVEPEQLFAGDVSFGLVPAGQTTDPGSTMYRPVVIGHLSLPVSLGMKWENPGRHHSTVAGVEVRKFEGENGYEFYTALTGNMFLASPSEKLVKNNLDRLFQQQSGTLASTASYQKLRSSIGDLEPGNIGLLYLRPNRIWKRAHRSSTPVQTLKRLTEKVMPGMLKSDSLMLEYTMHNGNVLFDGRGEQIDDPSGQAYLKNLDQRELASVSRPPVPDDTVFLRQIGISSESYFQNLKRGGSRQARRDIEREIASLNRLMGDMDFEKELIPALGDGVFYGVTEPGAATPKKLVDTTLPPNLFLALEIRTKKIQKKVLDLILKWMENIRKEAKKMQEQGRNVSVMKVKKHTVNGTSLYKIVETGKDGTVRSEPGFQFGFSFQKGYLIFSTNWPILAKLARGGGDWSFPEGVPPRKFCTGFRLRGDRIRNTVTFYMKDIANAISRQYERAYVKDRVQSRMDDIITAEWKRQMRRQIRRGLKEKGLQPGTRRYTRQLETEMESRKYKVRSLLYEEEIDHYRNRNPRKHKNLIEKIQSNWKSYLEVHRGIDDIMVFRTCREGPDRWQGRIKIFDPTLR